MIDEAGDQVAALVALDGHERFVEGRLKGEVSLEAGFDERLLVGDVALDRAPDRRAVRPHTAA